MSRLFIWPKLRNKPEVAPEPANVTEALGIQRAEYPPRRTRAPEPEVVTPAPVDEKSLRGQPTVAVMIDEVGWFGKDAAHEPAKAEPAVYDAVIAIAPAAEVVAEPLESLPEIPSDLGVGKHVKWSPAMSKADLMKIALDLGLTLDETPTKAEIVDALKAHDSNG